MIAKPLLRIVKIVFRDCENIVRIVVTVKIVRDCQYCHYGLSKLLLSIVGDVKIVVKVCQNGH